MDRFHIEGMAKRKFDAGTRASISYPVPVEGTFASHGEVMPVCLNKLKEVAKVIIFDIFGDKNKPYLFIAQIYIRAR